MTEKPAPAPQKPESPFAREVGRKESRRIKARRWGELSVWEGIGMFGLVGWSIATPTLAGALLGHWLDKNHPGPHSWTLALLVAGLFIGCANAWHWVAREHRRIERDENDMNETTDKDKR